MQVGFEMDIARAAVLYIANRCTAPTYHSVLKTLYFADRKHLERFGSLMFGDTYRAYPYGPVAISTYELMTAVENGLLEPEVVGFTVAREQLNGKGSKAPVIHPLHDADMLDLSDSMIQCMDEALAFCEDKDFDQRTTASHDAAWKQAAKQGWTPTGYPVMSVESIAATLPDAELLLEYLRNPYPGEAIAPSQVLL